MANIKETLSRIMSLDGAIGACVVDSNSGMMLGAEGGAEHLGGAPIGARATASR